MSAISAERPYVVPSTRLAEDALWDWVRETAEDRLRRPFRREMARLRNQGRYAPGTEHLRTPEPADEPVRPPKAPTFVVLHLEPRAWQPDHYDWRVVARLSAVDLPVTENYQGTRSDELPARLGASLGKAFRMCDEPDNPAILQVVVPSALLDLEVEKWQLPADSLPLGVLRPVVVRCADGGPGLSEDADLEREARWNRLRRGPTRAAVLDCDDEMRVPVPVTAKLRGLPYETVPVLCRYGGRRRHPERRGVRAGARRRVRRGPVAAPESRTARVLHGVPSPGRRHGRRGGGGRPASEEDPGAEERGA